MQRPINYIVFLCYGNKGIFYECVHALLSLSRLCTPADFNDTGIWVYTDDPDWFGTFKTGTLPLYFRKIDEATIKTWRGAINFVHRVKVEALKDFTKDRNGNILYVDTDVVFTHRIDTVLQGIGNNNLYMHSMEGVVKDRATPILSKLDSHFSNGAKYKINGTPLKEMAMWNAGALGFNTQYRHLLDEVLSFTDNEYPRFPKHIVEQFAFSVCFRQAGTIKAAAPYIFHYWKLKEARHLLASFFDHFKNKSWEELTHYSALIQMPALMQEKVDFFHNRGIVATMLHKNWMPAKPDWAVLEKQL